MGIGGYVIEKNESSINQISFKVHRTSATIPMNITAKYVFENTKYFIG